MLDCAHYPYIMQKKAELAELHKQAELTKTMELTVSLFIE